MSGGIWGQVAAAAIDIGAELYNAHNQRDINRQNIKLAREQMAWEQEMSSTAIQRRAADIEKAGGNRALAFTNGSEASTPTYSRAQLEAPRVQFSATAKAMAAIQAQNIQADTQEKLATARSKTVQAEIDEASKNAKTDFTINDYIEKFEQSDIRTKLMRSMDVTTGVEAKHAEEKVEAFIRDVAARAKRGELDVKQIESMIETFGLGAKEKANLVQQILQIMLPLMKD